MTQGSAYGLVEVKNFVVATRNTGYRSTASAIAELVDNAIQADAKTISIFVMTVPLDGICVAVLDDGCGMDADTLGKALQFGGSNRFDSREGMGRFGMGLPNSSLSQCRRVDVYTWRNSCEIQHSFLDIDEILAGREESVTSLMVDSLPTWAGKPQSSSGTLVIWSKCDRLSNHRPTTIARKLHLPLGRRFRRFLYADRKILVNSQPVGPIDPLFCDRRSVCYGATEYLEPLEYKLGKLGKGSNVTVRFSLLPVNLWHNWSSDEKRRNGVSGGAGISIVRADREISYGWHFMGRRRKQNYDDWWRCEISFDPELDELFGVTHSKQEINPTPELEAILMPDMVAVANRLNNEVRERFAALRASGDTPAAAKAAATEWVLPMVGSAVAIHNREDHRQAGRLHYRVRAEPQAVREFLTWQLEDGILSLVLNENHPFFERVYQPLRTLGGSESLFHIECLLLAYARSEARRSEEPEQTWAVKLRQEWSDTLAAMLT